MSDLRFLDEAYQEAEKAAQIDEVPVGAVIVYKGQIIARSHNLKESCNDPLGHAEVRTLRSAALHLSTWRLNECTLYVSLEPCPMCLAACQQSRISRIVYGAKDPKGGALSLNYPLHDDSRLNHRFKVEFIEHPKSSSLLSQFFKNKRAAR